MSKARYVVFFTLLSIATGCGPSKPPMEPSSDPAKEVSADDAKVRATAAIPGGAVGDAKKEDDGDDHEWLVDVKLPSGGAVVVVEVERKNGEIGGITGEKKPFDYDFAPAGGFLKFGDAKGKALAAKAGDLEEWELDIGKSVYEFEIKAADGKTYEVEVDAKSGTVKKTAEKVDNPKK